VEFQAGTEWLEYYSPPVDLVAGSEWCEYYSPPVDLKGGSEWLEYYSPPAASAAPGKNWKWRLSPETNWNWGLDVAEGPSSQWKRASEDVEARQWMEFYSPPKKVKLDCDGGPEDHFADWRHVFDIEHKSERKRHNASHDPLKEEFTMWPGKVAARMRQSRSEFCQLRYKLRLQRQQWRDSLYIVPYEDWFHDWRWNLDLDAMQDMEWAEFYCPQQDQTEPEDHFQDWSHNLDQYDEIEDKIPENFFKDWLPNLNEKSSRSVGLRRRKTRFGPFRSKLPAFFREVAPVKRSSIQELAKWSGAVTPAATTTAPLKLPKANIQVQKADRFQRRIMVKCHAKQPNPRGF
jgi:hypothetical protein